MIKKILSVIALVAVSASAAILPISPTTKITIKVGEFSTITFPFDIKHIEKSPFIASTNPRIVSGVSGDAVIDSEALLNAESLPQPIKKDAILGKKEHSIYMTSSKRTISVYPNRLGSTELIVYGYKFPIHIKLLVREDAGAGHFDFKDYETEDKHKAKSFEMVPHEKVISKLIKYAFNDMVPPGYDAENMNKSYKKVGIQFKLIKKLKGDGYEVRTWIVKNQNKDTVNLYAEMFYTEGIYAIAFENDELKRGESTRMFIVQASNRR